MDIDMLSPVGSFFSGASSMASSALSSAAGLATSCFKGVVNGASYVANGSCSAVKNGISYSASTCAAYPKTAKVALGAIALAGAAVLARKYLPADAFSRVKTFQPATIRDFFVKSK